MPLTSNKNCNKLAEGKQTKDFEVGLATVPPIESFTKEVLHERVSASSCLVFSRCFHLCIYGRIKSYYLGGVEMRKGNSNKDLIKKLLGDSVDEAFVISAIESYCQTVLEDDTDWGKTLINKDLWQTIASQNLFIIEEHYK